MATIAGPKIQVPSALLAMSHEDGTVKPEWQTYFHSVQQTTFNVSRSGPTASRPTSSLDGRFIGMPYFDTDLGLTVYLKSVTPDVWVNGAGVPV